MRKCLDCKHLEANMLEEKNAPKMFQKMLYLHCKKFNHGVVGYDTEGQSNDCMEYERRAVTISVDIGDLANSVEYGARSTGKDGR